MKSLLTLLAGNQPIFPLSAIGCGSIPDRTPWLMTAVDALGSRQVPVRMLEIGSFAGWSALALAEAAERCLPAGGTILCVDAWDPYASDADLLDPVYRAVDEAQRLDLLYGLFRHNTGPANPTRVRIDHFRGRSSDVLPYLAPGFDLINIDASHYHAEVAADIAAACRLVAEGGVICGDDLELSYDMVDQEQCDAAMDRDTVRDRRTGLTYHPGVTRAVYDAFGPVRTYNGFWIVRKTQDGFRDVAFDGIASFLPKHMSGMTAPHPSSEILQIADIPADPPVLVYGTGTAGRLARQRICRLRGQDVSGYLDREEAAPVDGLTVRGLQQALDAGEPLAIVIATQHWREVRPKLVQHPHIKAYVHYQVADSHLFRV